MSAISDAKELITAASEAADQAIEAAGIATTKLNEAIGRLDAAAGDTGHEKIDNTLRSYRSALENLAAIEELLGTAKDSANEYAEALG
jgi:hypothetical protein